MRFSLATLLMLVTVWGPGIGARPEQDAVVHYNLGNARSRKGQLDEAIAEYRKAIELDPSLAMAKADLEKALRLQRNREH